MMTQELKSRLFPSTTGAFPASRCFRMAGGVARGEPQSYTSSVAACIGDLSRQLLALGFGATKPHEPEPGVLA